MAEAAVTAVRLQGFIERQNAAINILRAERDAAYVLDGVSLDHVLAEANTTAEELEKLAKVLIQQLEL